MLRAAAGRGTGVRAFGTEWRDASTGDRRDYWLRTWWRIPAELHAVMGVIAEPADLVRWCPWVFLDVEVRRRPAGTLVGTEVRLLTRGWLPYTLRFDARIAEASSAPPRLVIHTRGDFDGCGVFRCRLPSDTPDGRLEVTLDWRVRVHKPVVARLSRLLWPVFARNHAWTMARGYQGLVRELERRGTPARPSDIASRAA